MWRVALNELTRRRGRTLALLLGILVATASFTVLTGTSESQRLDVRGTVAHQFRGDYDILVRPRGARDGLEARTGQLRPNFLSDTFGGISFAQWRKIQHLPGVEVAAPLANIGYLLPTIWVPVDVGALARGPDRALLRARMTWISERGLTRVADPGTEYTYVTPNPLREPPQSDNVDTETESSLREHVAGARQPLAVCNNLYDANPAPSVIFGPFAPIYRSKFGCYSRASHNGMWDESPLTTSPPQIMVPWVIPMLLTAVDPSSEARLSHLDRAVRSGRYLVSNDHAHLEKCGAGGCEVRRLPVLIANRTYESEQVNLAIERLRQRAAARWVKPFQFTDQNNDFFAAVRWLLGQPPGPVVQHVTLTAADAYRVLLQTLRPSAPWSNVPETSTVWRTSPIAFAQKGDALAPVSTVQGLDTWRQSVVPLTWAYPTPASQDIGFRDVRSHPDHVDPLTKPQDGELILQGIGTFDPAAMGSRLQQGSAAIRTLQPSQLTARDTRSARALGGSPLLPNGHLGGYLAQPPSIFTTLAAARAFAGPLFADFDPSRSISAIRVRVAGVTGIDAVSRERIRQAALRIATATGLTVDIMAGSSGAATAIDLSAGRYGRPALAVSEIWERKGVAVSVLAAIDRKSVVLFALILIVCALFVANATSAAVRARRTELGVLAALGWSSSRLFAVVLIEVATVGMLAGVLGGLLALPAAAVLGIKASLTRGALAIPAATALAAVAGLVPAARAARAQPLAAVRPAVLEVRRAWRPRTVSMLALVNLLRSPGRTALGALSLAIGVCALTLLLAATLAFHDTLVGTLLGNAVAVDIRASDYAAVTATVLLGVAAVADVLFLNLRERSAELGTLIATGWDDRALSRLVAYEGLWIGCLGAMAGAVIGLGLVAVFAHSLPTALLITTLGAAAAGIAMAGLAGLAPARWLRRAPLVPVLAGE